MLSCSCISSMGPRSVYPVSLLSPAHLFVSTDRVIGNPTLGEPSGTCGSRTLAPNRQNAPRGRWLPLRSLLPPNSQSILPASDFNTRLCALFPDCLGLRRLNPATPAAPPLSTRPGSRLRSNPSRFSESRWMPITRSSRATSRPRRAHTTAFIARCARTKEQMVSRFTSTGASESFQADLTRFVLITGWILVQRTWSVLGWRIPPRRCHLWLDEWQGASVPVGSDDVYAASSDRNTQGHFHDLIFGELQKARIRRSPPTRPTSSASSASRSSGARGRRRSTTMLSAQRRSGLTASSTRQLFRRTRTRLCRLASDWAGDSGELTCD